MDGQMWVVVWVDTELVGNGWVGRLIIGEVWWVGRY